MAGDAGRAVRPGGAAGTAKTKKWRPKPPFPSTVTVDSDLVAVRIVTEDVDRAGDLKDTNDTDDTENDEQRFTAPICLFDSASTVAARAGAFFRLSDCAAEA
jgi:hypothetical protein